MEAVGISLSPKEEHKRILSKWGKTFRVELTELLKEHPELVDKASEVYHKEYWSGTFINSLSVLPGTNDLLKRLNQKYILAVATGNTHKMLDEIIPHFSIPNVFSQIVSSHDLNDQEKAKPHPYMLEIIMKTQGVTPNETVFVGDARTDVQMAFNAHVTPIVVLTGHLNREEAEELGVKKIIPDITHLENVLV